MTKFNFVNIHRILKGWQKVLKIRYKKTQKLKTNKQNERIRKINLTKNKHD